MARYDAFEAFVGVCWRARGAPAWAGQAFFYVTNSAGDSIHVIDFPGGSTRWCSARSKGHPGGP